LSLYAVYFLFLPFQAENKYEQVKRESLKGLYTKKKTTKSQMNLILEQIKNDNEEELEYS